MAKKVSGVDVPGIAASSRPSDTEIALSAVNVEERKPDDVVYTPKVTSSSRGKISATLEGVADEYKRLYPDLEVRWVFHSARKPELSNVISRMAEGYSMVDPKDFKGYPIEPFIDEKDSVRLADVVLMKIPAGQRKVNRIERQRLADSQLSQVKEGFHDAMSQVSAGRHQATPRGGIKLEEKDHDLNYTQPDSKE